jgi:hypothetical protein
LEATVPYQLVGTYDGSSEPFGPLFTSYRTVHGAPPLQDIDPAVAAQAAMPVEAAEALAVREARSYAERLARSWLIFLQKELRSRGYWFVDSTGRWDRDTRKGLWRTSVEQESFSRPREDRERMWRERGAPSAPRTGDYAWIFPDALAEVWPQIERSWEASWVIGTDGLPKPPPPFDEAADAAKNLIIKIEKGGRLEDEATFNWMHAAAGITAVTVLILIAYHWRH